MINKKIVIICSIITLVIVGAIVGIKIKNFKDTQNAMGKTNDSQISNNKINNENIISKENNETTENQTNDVAENTSSQEQVKGEEETKPEVPENATQNTTADNNKEENSDEAAVNLVKQEWGTDDTTVYYTIDTKSNDTYIISVRSKSTTEQLAEYEVDLKDKTVVIK